MRVPRDASALGYCDTHQKLLFDTRQRAKNAIRNHTDRRGMRAYACDIVDGMFHIGHLPERVRRGDLTAAEIYPRGGEARA